MNQLMAKYEEMSKKIISRIYTLCVCMCIVCQCDAFVCVCVCDIEDVTQYNSCFTAMDLCGPQ